MKKVLMIVFVGIMMLSLSRCSSNNNSNNTQGETKGTKEYKDLCSGISTCLKAIDKAQDCNELKKAIKIYLDGIYNSDFDLDEMCTDEELKEWDVKLQELDEVYEAKAEELGCDKYIYYRR